MSHRTLVIIEVEHRRPIPKLANLIAGRAWSIDGVIRAEVAPSGLHPAQLQEEGFTLSEISLGAEEVHRT